MKRVTYLLFCAAIVLMTACSDNPESETAVKKNELGLIIPQVNASQNVLLLENGILTRPVSGIDNFNTLTPGSKLLVNYRILDVVDGITNIAVTTFAEANDSKFTTPPDPHAAESLYSTSFSGTYFITNHDSTEVYSGNVVFAFDESQQGGASTYSYSFTPGEGQGTGVSGTGSFQVTAEVISFSEEDSEHPIVPRGEFNLYFTNDWLYLWNVGSGDYYSYALHRD